MKKSRLKPDQILHAIDFSERLTDTKLWLRMADDLIAAANILEIEVVKYWSEIQFENNRIVKISNRKYVQGAYSLLIAYALENYFKALLIHRNIESLKGKLLTKLPKYLSSHNLCQLASKSKFKHDLSEEDLLSRLSRSSIWAARYPIPVEPNALNAIHILSNGKAHLAAFYSPNDINHIHNFINRLRNYVLTEIENNE
ncbi:MAG TPA: hypothetical protein DIU00_10235 [Phycisphaerales bacterium]|nr:hypothetical protein [Phycisphaerales bacterium]